jgi:hypothetical protein
MTADRPVRVRGVVAASALLLACGCNDIFGVRTTELVDARYFDAGIDAPFTCPAPGGTPEFDRNVVQAVFQDVHEYTTSATTGRAIGRASEGIVEGPIDELMTVMKGLEVSGCLSCAVVRQPRFAPEGDGVYAMLSGMTGSRIVLYRLVGDTWMIAMDFGPTSSSWISSVTPGPVPHMMLGDGVNLNENEVTDKLSEIAVYTPTDLAVKTAYAPMLTSDGLHMIFVATDITDKQGMYYADRADLAARFSTGRLLVGVPVVTGAYVPEDCSRIYLSGLGSVFYAPRI